MTSSHDQRTTSEAPIDESVLMDHEYDGIQEYDNPMPGWWKLLFLLSAVFAAGYVFWYHVSGRAPSILAAYEAEVAEANRIMAAEAMKHKPSEESLGALMADANLMQQARELFTVRCVQCHADNGQGNIGPNLTDDHWIHGRGKLMDIYNVVSDGVEAKGMPPWKKQLSPVELKQIVAFVGTLRGTNVPGKAPEGNPVSR